MRWWTLRKLDSKDFLRRLEAIEKLKDKRELDHLATCLSSRYQDVRRGAAFALAEMGDRRAIPYLGSLTHDLGPEGAVEALCSLGDPAGIESVVGALLYLKLSSKAAEAAAAFVKSFGRQAIPYLEAALRSREVGRHSYEGPEQAAHRAAAILESIGWSPSPGPEQTLFAILRTQDYSWDWRLEPNDLPVPHLNELSSHPWVSVRKRVVRALAENRDLSAATVILTQMLHDRNSQVVREMAAQALARVLGRAGGEVAVQSLLEMLNDKDYNAREDAARALGQIGDPRAVLPLIQVLEQQGGNAGNHLLASAAAQALGQIGDPRAVPPLFKLLDVAPPLVREAAVRALGRINDPAAAQALSEAATKVVVVTAVAKVLTEIDDPRAIKPLLLLARDRIYAKRVVNHLCQIMQLCAGNVSPEDLSALVHIGQVWQAEWYHNEHDDDYGWSDDSHPVDTAGLVQLASEELKRRASQR